MNGKPTLRSTKPDKLSGTLRLMLGVLFVMTGVMKLLVPMLADAWSGQLLASGLPFITLTRWTVPFVEVAVGLALLAGTHARLASLIVIGIMLVATYVHLVVDDPSLFPLQPSEPIIPIIVIAMASYVLWKGGGSWSRDLKAGGDR
jgi:uncharacterized membrane protein YphA (DoxX/SURF4 family)